MFLNMKSIFYSIICIIILCIPVYLFYLFVKYSAASACKDVITSSPVKEMYHKQLVATIDSIIDAKSYEEVVDSDDVTLPHDKFGRIIYPSTNK
jgi:hypothetical protein